MVEYCKVYYKCKIYCLEGNKTGLKSVGYLVTGKIGMNQISGPVCLVNNIGQSVEETSGLGAKALISILISWSIILSADLGIMNLFPLPALDGGRLVYYLKKSFY